MNGVSAFYGQQPRISARLTIKRSERARKAAERERIEEARQEAEKKKARTKGKKSLPTKREASQDNGEEGLAKKKPKKSASDVENGEEPIVEKEKEEAYRSLIQKNISEKMAFLQSLGFNKLKAGLVPPPTPASSKPSRPSSTKKPKAEKLPARKSLRLQNKPVAPLVESMFYQEPAPVVKKEGPLHFVEVLEKGVDEGSTSCLCEELAMEELGHVMSQPLTRNAKAMLSRLSELVIDDTTIQKVVPSRITGLAVHPSITTTLVFAGDKLGNFGFLKLGQGEKVVEAYSPHTSGLMCLKIRPNEPQKIYSGSYDDTLRCADIERGIFDEVFRVSDDVGVMWFDWMLDNSMIVSHANGDVSFVDVRAQQKQTGVYSLHDRKVRTIDAHPTKSWCFLTGSTDSKAKLWDARMLSKKKPSPIATLQHHRSCSAAFFSPVEGNSIVTTSFDDTLRIFDCSQVTEKDVRQQVVLKHNNNTGRWLTPFKAVWMPGCDELFLVGSMEYPRRIEVYSSGGSLQRRITAESLSSICSLIDVHPERLVIAGGNSSGKVHVLLEP